ncbi:fatty acid alpha-hydroxylase [Cytospora paraplurivora]|uniref:Ceramide very long chain fatty acid hydroxylase n=1 Tax=Cytospora paraplurivora TaxID=2898453 RepID=A0AAN9UFA3_9PEZI
MPSRTLPTFTLAEVEAHNSAKSCYVTVGENVYDVTDFVDSHPGGGDLITDWAGKDITAILKDPDSHTHSEAAYEILVDSLVGFLVTEKSKANGVNGDAQTNGNGSTGERWVHPRTGMACEEDLEKETDFSEDYKKHKFLDLNKPLFAQVWFGGFSKDFYLDQIHRPRHYRGGESAPFFGNFLEPLTKTPWWMVPLIWWPCVAYGVYDISGGFEYLHNEAIFFGIGFAIWSLVEYLLHSYLPDNRVGITLHFTLHGVHHYLPMDKYRLVMPPTLFVVLAAPFWKLAHFVFFWNWYAASAVFFGGVFGYTLYDVTHYFLHHQKLPQWYQELKKHHLEHHFLDYENGFGVSTKFWDGVFGTQIVRPPIMKTK